MPTTQYIGSRYVPLLADPVEWSSTKEYEPLTIVTYEGNSYTSRQFVPKGIDIDNEAYWALTGNYNAQIEQYRRETAQAVETTRQLTEDAVSQVDTWLQDAQNKYGAKPFAFDTVAGMQNAYSLLYVGAICHTNGFHASGDGGAAWYVISATGTANDKDVLACGSLFANLIETTNTIDVDQYGCSINNVNNNSIFDYCRTKAIAEGKVVLAKGTYNFSGPINLNNEGIERITINNANFLEDGFCIGNQYKSITITGKITANGHCIYVHGDPSFSPRYIQRLSIKGINKNELASKNKSAIRIESNNRGVAYIELENLLCNTTPESNDPALEIVAITNDSFANNIYVNNCDFNRCGDDRYMVELVAYTAWLIEHTKFENSSVESASTNAAGGFLLENVSGVTIRNCRAMEHVTRSGKKIMKLVGRCIDNVYDNKVSTRLSYFDYSELRSDVPFGFNYITGVLYGQEGTTIFPICDNYYICQDGTVKPENALRQRRMRNIATGSNNLVFGIDTDTANGTIINPKIYLTNESAPIQLKFTNSFLYYEKEINIYFSNYYKPNNTRTTTIVDSTGHTLVTLNKDLLDSFGVSTIPSGMVGHITIEFVFTYGTPSYIQTSFETISEKAY